MNFKRIFSAIFFSFVCCFFVMAQQPYGGCWHPEDIIKWMPESDQNAKFNRSTVALQPRFKDLTVKANQNQYYEGQVAACLTMNPMCSKTPSQGANNFIGYNPTYWQYLDVLIWWGGAADEGIIVPPSAPVTDIAHLHGVKVLGNIFFPQPGYGGQGRWVREILTKEGTVFTYGRKLFDIANYYGFDGWFINEETYVDVPRSDWADFVRDYMDYAASQGVFHHEIQFYKGATTFTGYEELMQVPNSSFFLNYGSPTVQNIEGQMTATQGYGYTKEEAFKKIYFGIECAKEGLGGNATDYKNLFPVTGHTGSIDMFNPEEHAWKQVVKNLLETPKACGEEAYSAMETVFSNEARFWTNVQHDPSNVSGREGQTFPGLANAIMERTTIQSKPFVTSFSAGLGKARYVNGEKRGTQDWYHRGMQNILPTWRWWIETSNGGVASDLKVKYNWDDAYNFGTSLDISGKLNANSNYLMRLYKTKLPIANRDQLQLVYKTDFPGKMEVQLGVSEQSNALQTFVITNTITQSGWTVAQVDLSSLAGKTVSIIALNFKSSTEISNYKILLGQLAVMENSYAPAALKASNLIMENKLGSTSGYARLTWDAPVSEQLSHFNVYTERGGVRNLVGQTRNEGFYIPTFNRLSGDENNVKFSIVAVTKDMKEGAEESVTKEYAEYTKPAVTLKASKTLVKKGEEITLTARADNYPTGYAWNLPEGATLVSQNGASVTVKFDREGLFDIETIVTNAVGSTTYKVERLIEVSETKVLKLISVGKTIHSYSKCLPKQEPTWLVDGVRVPTSDAEKWCAGGQKDYWTIIDLGEVYKLYRFQIYDCGVKEAESGNVKKYRIWVSNDVNASNWTLLVDETDRPENIKDDYAKPTAGRYVKIAPYDSDAPFTLRLYEFEIYGVDNELQIGSLNNIEVNVESTTPQTTSFSLGVDPKEDNFQITVTSDNEQTVKVTNLQVNESAKTISYDLEATQKAGMSTIKILLKNGLYQKSFSYEVRIKNPDFNNILFENVPKATTGYYFVDDKTANNTGTKGITDGNDDTYWRSGYYPADQIHSLVFTLNGYYTLESFRLLFIPTQSSPKATLPAWVEVHISYNEDKDDDYELIKRIETPQVENEFGTLSGETILAKFIRVRFGMPTTSYTGACVREIEAVGAKFEGELPPLPVKKYTALTNLSGFNADVIAEAKPSADYTTESLDSEGWVFYTYNIYRYGGFPENRQLTSTGKGRPFELASYDGNNVLLLKDADESRTLLFENKESADAVYILGTGAGGAATVKLAVNYEDGTKEHSSYTFEDWYSDSSTGSAVYALSRILRVGISGKAADTMDDRYKFRLFDAEVLTNPNKKIESVTIQKTTSTGRAAIFAVTKMKKETDGTSYSLPEKVNIRVWPTVISRGEQLYVQTDDTNTGFVQLISLQGTILDRIKIQDGSAVLSTGHLASGVYLLQLSGINGVRTAKIIVK